MHDLWASVRHATLCVDSESPKLLLYLF